MRVVKGIVFGVDWRSEEELRIEGGGNLSILGLWEEESRGAREEEEYEVRKWR